jgi:subtilase family serine protease
VGIGDGGRGNGVPHYHIGDGPDLIVSEFSLFPFTPVQGEPVAVRIGVYNQGNQPTGPFTVQWWPGENYREPAKTWQVSGVRARGGRILTFTYDGYPSWYARLRTKVVVDAAGEVTESEERNNTGTMTISVYRP